MNRTMGYANKQLIDILVNYFLENFVSTLLRYKLNKTNNRAVKRELKASIVKTNTFFPNYILLLLKYEDKIKEY